MVGRSSADSRYNAGNSGLHIPALYIEGPLLYIKAVFGCAFCRVCCDEVHVVGRSSNGDRR